MHVSTRGSYRLGASDCVDYACVGDGAVIDWEPVTAWIMHVSARGRYRLGASDCVVSSHRRKPRNDNNTLA